MTTTTKMDLHKNKKNNHDDDDLFFLTPTEYESSSIKPGLSKLQLTFIVAAMRGDLGTLDECKEHGVNINLKAGAKYDENGTTPFAGWTAAHFASWKGKAAAVRLLQQWGANLEAKDNGGLTPFMVANGPAALCLKSLGVDVFAKDNKCKTRLNYRNENWLLQYCYELKTQELERKTEELEDFKAFVAAFAFVALAMMMMATL